MVSIFYNQNQGRWQGWILILIVVLSAAGCAPRINLFPDGTDPLKAFVIEGKAPQKIVMIPVHGFISDRPEKGILTGGPSMVQEIVSQLRVAERDENVKAILLKIDSPGGTITASDMLYKEIMNFKERTGVKVVAVLMGVAASGGYYLALAADHIIAHPTTITGSVGVIFLHPGISGLMEKIGLDMQVSKSGKNKDMGSPFRTATQEEKEMLRHLIDHFGGRFVDLAAARRKLDLNQVAEIRTARIFTAGQALDLDLIDQIGYLADAVNQAKSVAELPSDSQLILYRRTEHPDDNLYNSATSRRTDIPPSLFHLNLPGSLNRFRTGFYYLWPAAAGDR